MRVKQEATNFENENWMYLVVGYYEGKAVLKDEEGELFFLECEENEAPEGTCLQDSIEVTPIEVLEEKEQKYISGVYGQGE